ncbi:ribonuclease R family protein [Allofournierella sp.]|uniref:ribonuclease R family protein n=1 Tax=Allofournierella sp. TaxID=1940256 RepID=UPI003AB14012
MSIRSKVLREIEKKPRRLKELKEKLGNDKKVQRAVEELLAKGRICQKQGAYFAVKSRMAEEALPCTLVKLGGSFGFAAQNAGGPDVFIPSRGLSGALPGDGVLVRLYEKPRVPGSLEGEVLAVTEPRQAFVGTVTEENGRLYLAPDECPSLRIQIKKSADGGAQNGDKAAVELLTRGADYAEHRAGVAMRFGSAGEAKQCVRALLYSAGLSRHFPEKVKAEARKLAEPQAADLKKRTDLRHWPIFTIDSAHTKDIDDAISLAVSEAGYELGVHIADVSHYVRPGSELNKEALRRGTSVYYADSVIPMLPRQLSNGLCSLNEGADRLAFSCLMQLDAKGQVKSFRFEKTVIRSRVKGVYSELNALLEGAADDALQKKYADVAEQLPAMRELYEKRTALRRQRGGIELESGEAKLLLDEEGRCVGVEKRRRGLTERMIEEFMLLANGCAARLARENELPFVYRVHEEPDPERVEKLQALLRACGLKAQFAGEVPTQPELAALLDSTRGTPLERPVHTAVLRTMAKAKYEPEPKGHYGLALADYAHFTSPIRRYPDLAIHRILSDWCAGVDRGEVKKRYEKFAAEASGESSAREVAAMQLERAAEGCYKAEYMGAHLGETFGGIVSGVTRQGLYVELENTVEGLVRTDTLCKGEPELTEGVRWRDPLTGRQWDLGQAVQVKALAVDVALGHVDFELLED